jgi:hypothetical protein
MLRFALQICLICNFYGAFALTSLASGYTNQISRVSPTTPNRRHGRSAPVSPNRSPMENLYRSGRNRSLEINVERNAPFNISAFGDITNLRQFVKSLESDTYQGEVDFNSSNFRNFLYASSFRIRNKVTKVHGMKLDGAASKLSFSASNIDGYLWTCASLALESEEVDLILRSVNLAKNRSIIPSRDAVEHILETIALVNGPGGPLSQAINLLKGLIFRF